MLSKVLALFALGSAMPSMTLSQIEQSGTVQRYADQVGSKQPYLWTLGFMSALMVIAILGVLFLRPKEDNTAVVTLVIAAFGVITGQLLTYLKSDATDKAVNSRMGQMQGMIEKIAFAEGMQAAGKMVFPAAPVTMVQAASPAPVSAPVQAGPSIAVQHADTVKAGDTTVKSGDTVKIEKSE